MVEEEVLFEQLDAASETSCSPATLETLGAGRATFCVPTDGLSAEFLTRLGISPEEARRRVLAAITAVPEAAPPGTAPLPRSALDLALALANARAGEIAAQLCQVKAETDAAHAAGDTARVTAMHEREKALLAERAELITELLADGGTPPPSASPE